MAQKTKSLSYPLNEFMKYKNNNKEIPQDLVPYCYTSREYNDINVHAYSEEIKLIISTINNGNNTNDVIFINDVKYLVNTINKKNYNDALNKLRNLDFSLRENVQFLAHELIVGTMRCPIGIKGIYQTKLDIKPLSELISNVIKYFCFHLTKEKNGDGGFHDELLRLCRKFFMDFVNLTKSMDQSNENTIDNYRGFMTLMGLIYEHNLISHKIVLECIDSIKRTIFCSKISRSSEQISSDVTDHHQKMFGYKKKFDDDLYNHIIYFDTQNELLNEDEGKDICYRNQTECSNFYKGYENLINHIIISTEMKLSEIEKKLIQNKNHHNEITKIFDDVTKENDSPLVILYREKHHFHEMNDNVIEFIQNDLKNTNDNIDNINNQIEKQKSFLELIISTHDDFTVLNQRYKTINKHQQTSPLKHHILIIHKEKSEKLKELQERILRISA